MVNHHPMGVRAKLSSNRTDLFDIQGYPHGMRLKRQLYRISLVPFLTFRHPCRSKLIFSVLNNLVKHKNANLKTENSIKASSRHVLRVLNSLYPLGL